MAKQKPSQETQPAQSLIAVILQKFYYIASKLFVIFPAISLEELQWGEAFSAKWFGMLGGYTLAGLAFFCLLQWLMDWLNSRAQKLADAKQKKETIAAFGDTFSAIFDSSAKETAGATYEHVVANGMHIMRRKPKATLRRVIGRTMLSVSGGFLVMAVALPLLIGISDGFEEVLSASMLAVVLYSLGLWLLTRILGKKLLGPQKAKKKATTSKV